MNMVDAVLKQLNSMLRFFAAPVVAFLAAWFYDDKHDVLSKISILNQADTGANAASWILILSVLGSSVYFAHRAAFHPLMNWLIVTLVSKRAWREQKKDPQTKPSTMTLDFQRWVRRGAKKNTPPHSVQAVLDEANAAGHFFYCTCWSIGVLFLLLKAGFPDDFSLHYSRYSLLATLAMFFVLALCNDYRTTKYDIEAFQKYP